MTRTEERLADALDAAARAVREETLGPLIVPERQRRTRHSWVAPVAAAAALLLAVGVGAAVNGHIPGIGTSPSSTEPAGPPPRYYVASQGCCTGSSALVVRATATGAVTDSLQIRNLTVPDPAVADFGTIAAAANGEFFIAAGNITASPPGSGTSQQLYRFRLTGTGRIAGLSQVPDGAVGGPIGAMAASPDGSQLAIALDPIAQSGRSAQILVINTATGARSVWQGGMARRGEQFGIASLSWTGNGGELVFLAQWFGTASLPGVLSNDASAQLPRLPVGGASDQAPSDAQVWALDATSSGGRLDAGQMLLRQSAQYPDIKQAEISADGTAVTAAVGSRGHFSVDQISVATGAQLGTLYQETPDLAVSQLSSDGLGGHWLILLNNGAIPPTTFSGWIRDGQLITLPGTAQNTLQGSAQAVFSDAWSAQPAAPAPSPTPTRVTPPVAAPRPTPPYYVETSPYTGRVVVRSTATGAVTATVGIAPSAGPLVSASGNGTFFVATTVSGQGPRVYRFRLTSSGLVTGLSALSAGVLGGANVVPNAIAASPDGSQVAVALGRLPYPGCDSGTNLIVGPTCDAAEPGWAPDDITVINTATGARSVWSGGMPDSLYIPSLSWTADGRQLVFLGQTCKAGLPWYWGETGCMSSTTGETFGVWALNPAQGGGQLNSGRLLIRQSHQYQNLVQALISGDGSTVTAVLVTGPQGEPDRYPPSGQVTMSVVQISAATGQVQSLLYQKVVAVLKVDGNTEPDGYWHGLLASFVPVLSAVPTGQYWLLRQLCEMTCKADPVGWTGGGQLFDLSLSDLVSSDAW